jgi:hypothetical protein
MAKVTKTESSYRFLLVPIALGLLLPSLIMPWVIFGLFGTSNLSPIDLLPSSSDAADSGVTPELVREHPEVIFHDLVESYNATNLYISSMATYLISIACMIVCMLMNNQRKMIVTLVAGILAITSAIIWFVMIESVKTNFAQQAALTGGLIGEEFRGNEKGLADTILKVGIGPYIVSIAGGVGISSYFIQKWSTATRAVE